jgi:DNA repair exonuclease SbcCD ATPase subunit
MDQESHTRTMASLEKQLSEAEENLHLIDERIAQYVQEVDVPLQLLKDQRRLQRWIARLQRRIADLKPIAVLRFATKLITGPVAEVITGEQWDDLRQQLLTQASRLPRESGLDVAALNERIDEMIQLSDEIQVLLMAYRIEPNPGQIEALRQHSDELAADLLRIYRLPPDAAPQLEALAQGAQSP